MRWTRFGVVGLLALAVATPIAAQQDSDGSSIVLILDGSGSMWGQIEDDAKITIAKRTMASIIEAMPETTRVGLILYGHRRKGDCDDVELAVEMGLVDKPALLAEIDGISPKGKTPITRSLRAAADMARSIEGEAAVVLVSDGEETCDPDPCAAVRELEAAGVPFVVHVIGFDVNDEQRAQLECIADAGGGKYFTASDAAELEFAARTATQTVAEAPASGDGRVWLDEPAVAVPGGEVVVHFEAAQTFHENAWVGIVPADVAHGSEAENDRHDTTYEYLRKRTSGTLKLRAPAREGSYDVRMHDSDHNGREVASAGFVVQSVAGRIWLDKTEFVTGEVLKVHFEVPAGLGSNAWAGIVPSGVPHGDEATNDENDLAYRYLGGRTEGTLDFTAPTTEGDFDVRLNDSDNDGSEIASASFTVTLSKAEVSLDKTTYAPGSEIAVGFTVPDGLPGNAWAGIVPSAVPHGSESTNDQHDLQYRYLGEKASGTLVFTAPGEPGSYDIRVHDTDNDGNEIASATFVVE